MNKHTERRIEAQAEVAGRIAERESEEYDKAISGSTFATANAAAYAALAVAHTHARAALYAAAEEE